MSSSVKPLDQFLPDFRFGLSVKEVLSTCSNGSVLLNKMAAMPIHEKKETLK